MSDANTKKMLWESSDWVDDIFTRTIEGNVPYYITFSMYKCISLYIAHIPKEILRCSAVSRELSFTSREIIENFRYVCMMSNPYSQPDIYTYIIFIEYIHIHTFIE
jgi:hypothetical protein